MPQPATIADDTQSPAEPTIGMKATFFWLLVVVMIVNGLFCSLIYRPLRPRPRGTGDRAVHEEHPCVNTRATARACYVLASPLT